MTHRSSAGFTLLELLVVLFIIGIIITFAVLSISGGAQDDRLRQEARRLQALLNLASDTAVMQGQDIGFVSDGQRYEFLIRDDLGVWQSAPDDTPLRARKLPSGIKMRISLDGFKLPMTAAQKSQTDEATVKPQIFLLSTQQLSPFVMQLSAEGTQLELRLVGKPGGSIDLLEPGQASGDAGQATAP